jgi:hypothetical protein
MMRKRLKHRPTRAEIGDVEPLRRLPSRSIEPRIYKTVRTGGAGDCSPPRHFSKGTAGRKRGSINYITAIMKDAVLRGAAESDRARAKDPSGGLIAYLKSVADEFPTAYMRLLARLIPHDLRLQMRAEMAITPQSAQEIRDELRSRGIPIDRLFDVPRVPSPGLAAPRSYSAAAAR